MPLSMTRPWKHPDSGFDWFRKRVPDDLRQIIGKREERFSLDTREPSEAKRLLALKLAEVEERWSNLRQGQQPLSYDDIAREADKHIPIETFTELRKLLPMRQIEAAQLMVTMSKYQAHMGSPSSVRRLRRNWSMLRSRST